MKYLILIQVLLFTGCATLQSWQANPKVQFAETEAIKLAAAFFSNGGSVDSAWGVANGLNIVSDVANFAINQQKTSATLKSAVKDFSGDPAAVTGLANGVVAIINKAAPQSPEQTAKLVQVVAGGIQKAAQQASP